MQKTKLHYLLAELDAHNFYLQIACNVSIIRKLFLL